MAPRSSTLAWKIPWTEEPGRLQTMGLRRVGHDKATSLSLFPFIVTSRLDWQEAVKSGDQPGGIPFYLTITFSRLVLERIAGT